MSNFVVDPGSVSFEEIRDDILAFLEAAPDSAKWRDMFQTSVGLKLVEIISALGTFLKYDIVVARREGFIHYARNQSSVIGAAQTLGYSAFRGRNTILKLTVVPNFTGLLSKYEVVGTVKDLDLIMLADTAVNNGVPVELEVIIGELKSEEVTVNTTGPAAFRFTQDKVSSDLRVFLNDVEVPSSERMLDLISEKFTVSSNVLGSVDVRYLNLSTFATKYNVGDVMKLEWIALNNLDYAAEDLKFDFGTISSFIVGSNYQAPEEITSVQVNAPLYSETQFTIRGRDDYMKVFKLLNVAIKSTDYTDVSPAVIDLCYAQYNSCLFTQPQLDGFVAQLSAARPMGLQPPTITHPTILFLDLNVVIQLLNSSGDPVNEVESIIETYENVLRQKLSFADLEQKIEALPFVKIARVSYAANTWQSDTRYRLGKHVKASPDTQKIYKLKQFVYLSGDTEPTWPNELVLGTTVEDGRIKWALVVAPETSPAVWVANTQYKLGDMVSPSVALPLLMIGPGVFAAFQAVEYINRSNPDTPPNFAGAVYSGALCAWVVYNGVKFIAKFGGIGGNAISLSFDGIMTVQQVVDAWNAANPSNPVTFSPASANTSVLPAGNAQLANGAASSNLSFKADVAGTNGNNISVSFDGIKTALEVITSYNTGHPGNTVSQLDGSGNEVLPEVIVLEFTGGSNLVSGEPIWPGSLLPPC